MRVRLRMPWSVRLAALALLLAAGVEAGLVLACGLGEELGWLKGALAPALFAVILVGMVRASRLAWRWGRHLGLLFAAGLAAVVLLQARFGSVDPLPAALLLAGVALPLVAHALALGHRTAFEWFGLVCPRCGAPTGRGDLLMWTARCERCGEAF